MEAIFLNLKSTLVFTIVLSILILVHEWGHFITARKLGVKVEVFSLGFGPKVTSFFHDGTEFMICLIPLGGFVKMAGDVREECKGTSDEFFSKSVGHRSLIVLNGPVVNFILAYISFVFVFMLGFPDLSNRVGELIKDYPAQEAGLLVGDEIVEVNANKVTNWTELQANISQSKTPEIKVRVMRDNQIVELTLVAKIEKLKNIFGQVKELKLIGIRPANDVILQKYSFGEAIVKSYQKLAEITITTYKSIYFMITGSMPAKESMTGPIGIFYIIKEASKMGFVHVLFILGVISASLAIFNLLPLIPLDGGHLFFLGLEKVRGKPLSAKADEAIAKFGFGLIICLAIFVFYSDFDRFGIIEKIKHIFIK